MNKNCRKYFLPVILNVVLVYTFSAHRVSHWLLRLVIGLPVLVFQAHGALWAQLLSRELGSMH